MNKDADLLVEVSKILLEIERQLEKRLQEQRDLLQLGSWDGADE